MTDDFESLQGFWKLIASSRDGEPEPQKAWGELNTVFEFTGHRFRHIRSRTSYRFELHPELTPKGVDFVIVSMKNRSPCIYQLEGDKLRILHCNSTNRRPSSFEEAGCLLRTYARFKRRLKVKRRVRAQIPSTLDPKVLGVTYENGDWVPCKQNAEQDAPANAG
jgi:uncharacterized protein (TIGR03067 family)